MFSVVIVTNVYLYKLMHEAMEIAIFNISLSWKDNSVKEYHLPCSQNHHPSPDYIKTSTPIQSLLVVAMDVTYDYPDSPKMPAPAPAPAPERLIAVSTNISYGKRFPKDKECVSKVENAGERENSSKKVLVLLFAICGCVLLVGAVSACLAYGLELFKLKSETASTLEQLKSETTSTLQQLKSETSSTLQQLNASINMLSQRLDDWEGPPAHFPLNPVASCAALPPSSPSGYYWVRASNGSSVSAYCDMTRSCGGVTGGWMRVAELDMTNSSHQCPSGLMERIFSGKRTCVRNESTGGCSSINFITLGVEYSNVCGRVIGYQYGTPEAFTSSISVDFDYVDGVSLTHGDPRQHIWTFAVAQGELNTNPSSNCPCTNTNQSAQATPPPATVGNDYFCDTGSEERARLTFYGDDPLWDGAGCGPLNTCCSFNTPPWFYKQLPQPTTDDIEMRVCRSGDPIDDEDVTIEIIEMFTR